MTVTDLIEEAKAWSIKVHGTVRTEYLLYWLAARVIEAERKKES